MKLNKIIFLDFDGVLNTARWHYQACGDEQKDEYGYVFDPEAVTNLAKIIEETGADIVVSSSWKFMGLQTMRKMWKDRNLPGKIVGITPNAVSDEFLLNTDLDNADIFAIKGQEIKEWLMLQGINVAHYVILDDMNDFLHEQGNHFVWINPEVGITTDNAIHAINILNQ